LIAKNVTKLVPNREAGLREEVDASLQSLLRCFVAVRQRPLYALLVYQARLEYEVSSMALPPTRCRQLAAGGTCRSFNLLDDALEAAMDGDDKAARKVDERMQATRDSMDRFDSSIKHCLHMA
jgi:hypothetical protein